MSAGFHSSFVGIHITTFGLDDTLVLLACITMTVAPAGRAFGPSWEKTSPFSSPGGDSTDLPSVHHQMSHQRRFHLRASISKPYPINRVFVPPPPGPIQPRQARQPLRPNRPSPLPSPNKKPVYQRPAYDMSPARSAYFQTPKSSPTYTQGQPSPGDSTKSSWPLRSPGPSKLVSPESLWG